MWHYLKKTTAQQTSHTLLNYALNKDFPSLYSHILILTYTELNAETESACIYLDFYWPPELEDWRNVSTIMSGKRWQCFWPPCSAAQRKNNPSHGSRCRTWWRCIYRWLQQKTRFMEFSLLIKHQSSQNSYWMKSAPAVRNRSSEVQSFTFPDRDPKGFFDDENHWNILRLNNRMKTSQSIKTLGVLIRAGFNKGQVFKWINRCEE